MIMYVLCLVVVFVGTCCHACCCKRILSTEYSCSVRGDMSVVHTISSNAIDVTLSVVFVDIRL